VKSRRYWFLCKDTLSNLWRPKITASGLRQYLENKELHPEFAHIVAAKRMSMLHEEVLLLLRYLAIASRGAVLEIGAYVGGATVVLASTAKRYRKRPIISIEAGGQYPTHPDIPSNDIFADLRRNIDKAGLSDSVHIFHGFSDEEKIQGAVEGMVRHVGIDMLVVDADGKVGRDVDLYSSVLNDQCVLVFDDYTSPLAPEKVVLVRAWVDDAVAEGKVTSLGVFGWGTWIGLYNKRGRGTLGVNVAGSNRRA
jgi:predicted O-methyltransferase YrrM